MKKNLTEEWKEELRMYDSTSGFVWFAALFNWVWLHKLAAGHLYRKTERKFRRYKRLKIIEIQDNFKQALRKTHEARIQPRPDDQN